MGDLGCIKSSVRGGGLGSRGEVTRGSAIVAGSYCSRDGLGAPESFGLPHQKGNVDWQSDGQTRLRVLESVGCSEKLLARDGQSRVRCMWEDEEARTNHLTSFLHMADLKVARPKPRPQPTLIDRTRRSFIIRTY